MASNSHTAVRNSEVGAPFGRAKPGAGRGQNVASQLRQAKVLQGRQAPRSGAAPSASSRAGRPKLLNKRAGWSGFLASSSAPLPAPTRVACLHRTVWGVTHAPSHVTLTSHPLAPCKAWRGRHAACKLARKSQRTSAPWTPTADDASTQLSTYETVS